MTNYSGVESAILIVDDYVQLSGIASGGVLVRRGGSFFASGVISGPLTIEAGGQADVSGVLSGPISIAKDAALDVSGIVHGAVLQNDGEIRAAVGAVIHNKQLTAAGALITPSSDSSVVSGHTPRFLLGGVGSHLTVVQPN